MKRLRISNIPYSADRLAVREHCESLGVEVHRIDMSAPAFDQPHDGTARITVDDDMAATAVERIQDSILGNRALCCFVPRLTRD